PAVGAANANHQLEGTCPGDAVAGTYTLDIPEKHADYARPEVEGGPAPVEYTAKDAYKDGYIWIQGEGADRIKHEMHRIKRNDAGDGTSVRLYLFEQIKYSQDTPWITAYPNKYNNVVNRYNDIPTQKMGIVCVSLIAVSPNYHFWGLTWGPIWIPAWSATPGAEVNDREVYFKLPAGFIILPHEFTIGTNCYQRAGFVLPNTEYGGDMCIELQISP
ncbi:unnamed protein product, partial [marine sediment metagenome]